MNSQFTIEELVPHARTMSLLDDVVEFGDNYLVASVTIRPQSTFCEAQGVPAWIGPEYMAQTVAAMAGMKVRLNHEKPQVGFLVGTRRYSSPVPFFPVGSYLTIRVEQTFLADNGMASYECLLRFDSHEIAATLNVFQPQDLQQFLKGKTNE